MNENGVLIVEDKPVFRKSVRRALEGAVVQYDFTEAGSIAEGLTMLVEHSNIKVILLDLDLPDGTGADFLEQIKGSISEYRIIVLTGRDEKLAADVAKEHGVFNYLAKAQGSFTQSIRFTVSQAFADLEREQLKDKNQRLFHIHERINSSIKESLSPADMESALDDVLGLICKSVRKLVGVHTCHIRVYDLGKGDFHLAAFSGPDDKVRGIFGVPVRKDEFFSGKVAEVKKPLSFDDLQNNEEFKAFRDQRLAKIMDSGDELLLKRAHEYFDSIQSAFIVPITTRMFDGEIDAVFNVSSRELSTFFSDSKQGVINEFVSLATTAISKVWQKKRKQDAHEGNKRISKVLEDISKELGREDIEKQIYSIAVKGVADIINPETISIFLLNKTTHLLDNVAEYRGDEIVTPRLKGHPTAEGLTGRVFTMREALRIPNLQKEDTRKPDEHPSYNKALGNDYIEHIPSGRVDHYLGVPMIIGDEVVGAIQLLNKKSAYYLDPSIDKKRWLLERGFSEDCENVLGIAAGYLAVAIKNAELIGERDKKISQLETLKDVGRYITDELPINQLLEKTIQEAAEDIQAEICLLFLMNEKKNAVVLDQSYGIPQEYLPNAYYAIGEGLTGRVARDGGPVLEAADVSIGKYDEPIISYLQSRYGNDKKIESLMIVPIRAKNETLGVIKVINKKGVNEHYAQEDLSFFESFANYMGISLASARRYDFTNQKLAVAEKGAALSHLVRAVVHEINNTKALIPLNVQIMRKRIGVKNYDLTEMIDVIEDSAKQAVAFANSIQAFSASRLGNKERQDINPILRKAIRQLQPTVDSNPRYKLVQLEEHLSEEPLLCSVYETPLIQVFQNIMLNAYQAMEKVEAGSLKIESGQDSPNGKAIINFIDTGHGIAEENIEQIFGPDFTTKARGTGIGLWLSQTHLSVIEASMKVQSTINKGTTFTIEIPLA